MRAFFPYKIINLKKKKKTQFDTYYIVVVEV